MHDGSETSRRVHTPLREDSECYRSSMLIIRSNLQVSGNQISELFSFFICFLLHCNNYKRVFRSDACKSVTKSWNVATCVRRCASTALTATCIAHARPSANAGSSALISVKQHALSSALRAIYRVRINVGTRNASENAASRVHHV